MKGCVIYPETYFNPYSQQFVHVDYITASEMDWDPTRWLDLYDKTFLSEPGWVKKKVEIRRKQARNMMRKGTPLTKVRSYLHSSPYKVQLRGKAERFYVDRLPLDRCAYSYFPNAQIWVSYSSRRKKDVGLNPGSSLISLICQRPMKIYGPLVLFGFRDSDFQFNDLHLYHLLDMSQTYQMELQEKRKKNRTERQEAHQEYQAYIQANSIPPFVQQQLQLVTSRHPLHWKMALEHLTENATTESKPFDFEARFKLWG